MSSEELKVLEEQAVEKNVSCYISTQVHVIYTVYNLYLYILSCEFLIQGLAGLFIFNSYDINFV
jgi:hypothetical protein